MDMEEKQRLILKDITDVVARELGITMPNAYAVGKAIFNTIEAELSNGNDVCIQNFGIFECNLSEPKPYRDIATGNIEIAEPRLRAKFRISNKLRERLKAVK